MVIPSHSMGRLQRLNHAIRVAARPEAKQLAQPRNPHSQWWVQPAGHMPTVTQVGDGSANSIVVACLRVLTDGLTESPLVVSEYEDESEQYAPVAGHPGTLLWEQPNRHMDADILWHYVAWSTHVDGNGYLWKRRNSRGYVTELWPLRPDMTKPVPANEIPGYAGPVTGFIDAYRYDPGAASTVYLDPADIIHFRFGLDPNDYRLGYAPIKSVLREILGDEEAGRYATSLLANMAVPGVILTPDEYDGFGPTPDQAEAIKATYKQKFGGANRGEPMVLSNRMRVEVVAFSPTDLDLRAMRILPEERVSAAIGVPAIMAGFGAGLERSTFANWDEAGEHFAERKLVPTWKRIARQLTQQLGPDMRIGRRQRYDFDLRDVRALRQDQDQLWSRVDRAIRTGWITVADGRRAVGLPTGDNDDVYLRQDRYLPINPDVDADDAYARVAGLRSTSGAGGGGDTSA